MKALVLSALLMVLSVQFAQANSESECPQDSGTSTKIIREFR